MTSTFTRLVDDLIVPEVHCAPVRSVTSANGRCGSVVGAVSSLQDSNGRVEPSRELRRGIRSDFPEVPTM